MFWMLCMMFCAACGFWACFLMPPDKAGTICFIAASTWLLSRPNCFVIWLTILPLWLLISVFRRLIGLFLIYVCVWAIDIALLERNKEKSDLQLLRECAIVRPDLNEGFLFYDYAYSKTLAW